MPCMRTCDTLNPNVDPLLRNPLPIIGISIGILIFRPLKGGGSLIKGP